MPEGDTVYRSAHNLAEALDGEVLTRCNVRVPTYATVDLTGETIDAVVPRGKHLLMRVGDALIHSHLKMEGSWHLYARCEGERPTWQRPAFQARIVLETEDWQAVGFDLGLLEIVPRSAEEDVVGYLGPDLLGADWDPDEALRRLSADPERPIGLALLDQRIMAGLGNVYRAELCFLRGVLPTRPVRESGDLVRTIALAKRLITANRERAERTTTGNLRPGQELWVYGRNRRPCRRCGTAIARGELGDDELQLRVTYWCPHCQT
ncbi:DNA-formamidopyrimidine glycosylase family protein [Rathayibacter rathayi]|uniref:DNA-(apurinic or apyrimidinic site) lyase n=1 Tax=Rathayibacter rathayi TaxID=33887 RepID=A0ABD6W8W7_RATRA|nr:DNA-formamidopyrimidine glycosylase family protein [Rathayibacter rathayi]PPF14274.1 DNA glycosylase [Rathayibacter rathayi]PPH32768.1 DNA glycosylase [Rathayibacter rathayi]PPH76816.1 DNA glycosylase [Rathayibacter rathayi]